MTAHSETDVILAMQDPYMDQVIAGTKTYEFRKYQLKPTVKRIWFYRTVPHSSITHSSITHLAEIEPARTRNFQAGDEPLPENGLGNVEFNNRHPSWAGYDYAYKILTAWELNEHIPLDVMRDKYGFKMAPRGMLYLPEAIENEVVWDKQRKVLDVREKD